MEYEQDIEQDIANQIEQEVSSEIIEAKKQFKIRVPEIVVTSVALVIAVVFFCCGLTSFWGLLLIITGAMWNFFTQSNKLFACIMAFIVCTIFSVLAIKSDMYLMAFLHIMFYLPTQLIYYYENRKEADVSILHNKELKPVGLVAVISSTVFIAFCIAVVAYKLGEIHYMSDAIATSLLMLSVFLVNGRYKEYYPIRITACAVAVVVWLRVAIIKDFANEELVIMLLFLMYMVMDFIKFIKWEISYRVKRQTYDDSGTPVKTK